MEQVLKEHEQGADRRRKGGSGTVPYLSLNELLKQQNQTPPPPASVGDGYQPRAGSKPMNRPLIGVVVGVVVAAILLLSACYVVQPSERALVLQLGNPVARSTSARASISRSPSCRTSSIFDKRVLNYDAPAEEVPTVDQKQVIVSAFAVFQIVDPLLFYQTVNNEIGRAGASAAHHQLQSAPRAGRCLHGRDPDQPARRVHAGDRAAGEHRSPRASASR